MIKIGDHLQPTEHARVNYNFDKLGIKLPIVAVNVFTDSGGTMYVQFLAPPTVPRPEGDLILRTWNARNLVPYQPKERWRWMKCAHLRRGMTILVGPDRQYVVQAFSAIGPDQVICKVGNYTTIHLHGSEYIWAKEASHG